MAIVVLVKFLCGHARGRVAALVPLHRPQRRARLQLLGESMLRVRLDTMKRLEDDAARPMRALMPAAPVLENMIGHGGFGEVWRARFCSVPVAVKIAVRGATLGEEARLLEAGAHPSVLRSYGAWRWGHRRCS